MPCRATPSRPGASETTDERRCSADRAELSRPRHTKLRSRHTCARPRPISSSTRVEGGTPPSIGWGCAFDRSRGGGSGTVTELAQPPQRFREIARLKLADSHTQGALDSSTARLYGNRSAAWQALPEVQELRQRAHDARMRVIDDLDAHVARFAEALEARGGQVHFARTADDATAYVTGVCRRSGARLAAKSKSMLSEELDLNHALEAIGVRAVETDLGEYIIQLAGEHPAHILAPGRREDRRRRRRAPLGRRWHACAAGPRRTDAGRPPSAQAGLPRRRRRHHRRQLRRQRDGLDLPGHERGQRAAGHFASARPHRAHGDGTPRRRPVRPRRPPAPARAQRDGSESERLHDTADWSATPRRRGRARGAARRNRRQRPLQPARDALQGNARVHPLRRLPERLPRLPEDRRRRLRPCLLGADGRRAPAAPRGTRPGSLTSARVLALRSMHRRLPGQDPAPRAAARPAQGPGRDERCAALGAPRVRALVSRVVVAARLPDLDSCRARTAGRRRGRRARPRLGARRDLPRLVRRFRNGR